MVGACRSGNRARTLEHHEFLATDASDPRREFISSLCAALGETREHRRVFLVRVSAPLGPCGSWFPEFADRINAIQARLFDLLPVVREHTYHPAYAGSYSIKSVLPALVPEMTYEGMEVADGQDAGLAWESLVHAWLGSRRARQDQEGSAGLLRAGHAGDGEAAGDASLDLFLP